MYTFYKENDCKGDPIGTITPLGPNDLIYVAKLDGCSGPFGNDEARSVKLANIPAHITLTVWDSPCGMPGNDDWCTITTLVQIPEEGVFIDTFEQTKRTEEYVMEYHRVNGLDGKISLVSVSLGLIMGSDR